MKSKIILGVVSFVLLNSLVLSSSSFANCFDIKKELKKAVKKCNKNGGPKAPGAKKECAKAKEVATRYLICEQSYENAVAHDKKMSELLAEIEQLEAEQIRVKVERLELESKASNVANNYLKNIDSIEGEYVQKVKDLAVNYLEQGLDLEDPAIEEQFNRDVKALEKEFTKKLLMKMMEK